MLASFSCSPIRPSKLEAGPGRPSWEEKESRKLLTRFTSASTGVKSSSMSAVLVFAVLVIEVPCKTIKITFSQTKTRIQNLSMIYPNSKLYITLVQIECSNKFFRIERPWEFLLWTFFLVVHAVVCTYVCCTDRNCLFNFFAYSKGKSMSSIRELGSLYSIKTWHWNTLQKVRNIPPLFWQFVP